ncbi:putative fungal-specific transcription factor [Parachaetomium inaequale]|uniref:Fungal-specific transcription factor n=1 Tax=Parachaetomium inaequale TaxID=2588326 RepID=A0AAN6P6K9_9PEZI|nr:putative fungal-specific transcription factor [Parachaetomium inaequale]
MAEPNAPPSDQAGPPGSEAPSAATPAAVKLACYTCKRRKIKCDRQRPICLFCRKLDVPCEYPTRPEKPGPKTGSLQKAKRRRLNHSSGASSSGHGLASLSAAAGLAASADPARRNSESALSPTSCYSVAEDDSRARDDVQAHVAVPAEPPPASDQPDAGHPTSVPIFSRIMYPSHEAQTRPQSPSTVDASPGNQDGVATGITVQSVCEALSISRATYDLLMDSYFTNMTSFSLFRPGSIEPKFALMQHHSDAEALVAAMFSFSARHCLNADGCPSPSKFAHIASSKLDESVDRYGDTRPPFWLLQASILVTFYQLTLSVRSRSWRKLGDCIRHAYDLNLHIVDANRDPASTASRAGVSIQRWALLEERRRAWWAVWEMDVFASTIRRLPTAIDASLNLTMLPVSDSCWFNDEYQESCFLAEDCSLRWKHLARSGNQSARAWFIVVNSLMRNMQRVVYPAGSAMPSPRANRDDELNIMANCLYCTVSSLPADLVYQGETLDFRPNQAAPQDASVVAISPRQQHADKYAIHLMTQLCRFMIYHHKICARAPWLAQHQQHQHQHQQRTTPNKNGTGEAPPSTTTTTTTTAQQANSEWSNYINASDEIITVVRNSARDHYRYVNPFLVNTLWFAAAAQCACNVFGPPSFNKRLTGSNLDLLKLTIDRFIAFWGGMQNLQGKLARIETGLQSLMAGPSGGNGGGNGNGSERQRHRHRHRNTSGNGVATAGGQGSADGLAGGLTTTSAQMAADNLGLAPSLNGTAAAGTGPLLMMPGGVSTPAGWTDPNRWSSFGHHGPSLYGFAPQFPTTTGQNFYPAASADPMDFSPFGLEELLMAGMMEPQI